jgi:hypothetical protein
MRKRSTLRTRFVALLCVLAATVLGAQAVRGSELPPSASSDFANEIADRARVDVVRIQELIGEGSLPKGSLDGAEARLADVKDEGILAETLFSSTKFSNLTPDQRSQMLTAAERRVDRQAEIVRERQSLLAMGVVAKSEISVVNTELESRRHVLDLARDRIRLAEAERRTTQEEDNLEHALESGTSRKAMLKFEGSGHFYQGDFPAIASKFEQQFHTPLPVTAHGQTHLHRSFGLDHRGKIDVGLNPEEPEGIWLRRLLESRQIPYIAFRSAVRGAATAPHIHIGTGSARIGLARR